MNTPERKKLMNEPIENTPKDVQEQQRQGMLAQHGKSHRSLTYDDDDDDKKRKRDDMPTEAMKKMRVLTEQVKSKKVEPSESTKRMQEMIVEGKKPSENTGGGILEMFGLAGGRRGRRRKSRRKKRRKSRKSRRKRRKRTKKKRRRKSRKKSRRRRRR